MMKNSPARIGSKVPEPARLGRFARITNWAMIQVGDNGPLTNATVRQGLPRLSGLRYQPDSTKSPLGGRIDPHLRHVEDAEALERVARADHFIEETKSVTASAPWDNTPSGDPKYDDSEARVSSQS